MPKIIFSPINQAVEGVFDPPMPASKCVPNWYKDLKQHYGDSLAWNDNGDVNGTIKRCMPVFDVLTAGYIITLPADVVINNGNDAQWSADDYTLVGSHPSIQFPTLPFDRDKYEEGALKWQNPWHIKTPKGYSCLFIHPTYQDNVPFQTLPGIVDTDRHPVMVNFPFLVRKGYNGLVPMGTPIIQVIPFKRDDWESEVTSYSPELLLEWKRARRLMTHRYKRMFRSPKSYT